MSEKPRGLSPALLRADAGERIIEAMVDAALANAPAQPPGAANAAD